MKRTVMRSIAAGFLIGVGCVLPGVSGGVMAVAFGLYRPMLDAVLHFFRSPKTHLRFLFPLGIGGAAGILSGAKGLAVVMQNHEALMLFLFTGFLLGGLPALWQEARAGGKPRASWLAALLLGLLAALPLAVFSSPGAPLASLSPIHALLTGLLEGVGTIVPGVSTSFVLIRLGWYPAYLGAISTLALPECLLIGAGFGVSAILCMKGVQWLFDHVPGPAYSAVAGFLLLSIALVFPGFHTGRLLWADLGLLVIGAVCSRWLCQIESKEVNECPDSTAGKRRAAS